MQKRALYTIVVFIVIASLDNAAIALIPAILPSVAVGVGLSEIEASKISFIVAVITFITSVTSLLWGYYGDKYSRKKLLLYGTIMWASFIFLSGFAQDYTQLFVYQLLAGIGLGCIASVGFSVIIDFVAPARRGLALSLWGLAQGAGSGVGYVLAVVLNVSLGWNTPFWVLGLVTFGFVVTYFFTTEPERGATEEELRALFESGQAYEYKITRDDLRAIWGIRTNRYLVWQGLFAQVAWGGIQLLPTVLIYRFIAQGVPENSAGVIGPLIAGFFQIGGITSIIFGWLGDKYQKKTLSARSIISAIGVIIGAPLTIAMVLLPFPLPGVPDTNSIGTILGYLLGQLVSNLPLAFTLFVAFFAAVFSSASAPNFSALVGDVNVPEHRGTVYGLSNFVNGIGRTVGLVVLPALQIWLVITVPLEWSWVLSLIFTLLFFIPAGICYIITIRSVPQDIARAKQILAERGKAIPSKEPESNN